TKVREVNLASLCQRLDFVPAHIKMDIEGFEEEGLSGALALLEQYRPQLFLELHGDLIRRRGRQPEAVLCLLRGVGYTQWFEAGRAVDEQRLAAAGFNCRIVCLPGTKTY